MTTTGASIATITNVVAAFRSSEFLIPVDTDAMFQTSFIALTFNVATPLNTGKMFKQIEVASLQLNFLLLHQKFEHKQLSSSEKRAFL